VTLIEPQPGGHRSHLDPRSPAWREAVDWLTDARKPALATPPTTG
jgi:hypothetical protein